MGERCPECIDEYRRAEARRQAIDEAPAPVTRRGRFLIEKGRR
jgi:hypothetical protein